MAEKQGSKVVQVKIGGKTLEKRVKDFAPPSPDRPWWSILLENGNQICATGEVSVEFETGEPIPTAAIMGFVKR